MLTFNINDTIKLNSINKEVKALTIEDLYEIYLKEQYNLTVKIANGDLKLMLEKEE